MRTICSKYLSSLFLSINFRVFTCAVIELPGGRSPYTWSGSCAVELVRKQGFVNGLFQGMGSVFLREIPQFAVYYPWYEFTRRKGLEQGYFSPIIVQALAGGTAGIVQWLPPFYFFDVIKSRMQTSPEGKFRNIFHCAETLYKTEGYQVFFRYLFLSFFLYFFLSLFLSVIFSFLSFFFSFFLLLFNFF